MQEAENAGLCPQCLEDVAVCGHDGHPLERVSEDEQPVIVVSPDPTFDAPAPKQNWKATRPCDNEPPKDKEGCEECGAWADEHSDTSVDFDHKFRKQAGRRR